MQVIELTYIHLLTDVGRLTGLPIRGSAYDGLHWCVNDAPQLEKELLAYIEHGDDFSSLWPKWLIPLRDRFIRDENPLDLRYLRQLLLFCYKAEHRHTRETEQKAINDWLACNAATDGSSRGLRLEGDSLCGRARKHCSSVISSTDWTKIVPSHGPGAVYDKSRLKGNWSKWFTTIESCYPFFDYFDVGNNVIVAADPRIDDIIVARLVAVPKDARGPRLICVHPAESIWIQQGLRKKLESAIKHRIAPFSNIWPSGHVHFDDQTVNASMALTASLTNKYATIDLKEASDRLSDRLIQYLFGRSYKWFGCCRASYVEIDGKIHLIHSYAPMGNATTFPVQSLAFWSICVAAMEAAGSHDPSDCYVFGDDIIVPSQYAYVVIRALHEVGLLVNPSKTFINGGFRESCGTDAYKGVDVTPVRWKTSYDGIGLSGIQSMSNIAQRLRVAGMHDSSRVVYSTISQRLRSRRMHLACTNDPNHGGIAEYTDNLLQVFRDAYWHRATQQWVSPIIRLDQPALQAVHGWNHVLSSLTSLQQTGRGNDPASLPSRKTRLNRGWARVL